MAINKAKIIEGAQKLIAQGKLKEAVAEYERILKEHAKDLNALNTIGDLYVRLNKTQEALRSFTRLAELYVSDGFLVRGIAMYKKISKLDPASTTAFERLAELYTMQGLFTEARAQYLQVAEAHLKNKKTQEAIATLQKVLDLEPDNLQIQQRLAELLVEHGRKDEAAGIYRRVAERLLHREETQEAMKWLEKAVHIAPNNPEVLVTQASLLVEQGRAADAIKTLEKVPKLGEQVEALGLLLKCRLSLGEVDEAEKLAEEIFGRDPKHFAALLQLAEHAAEQGDAERATRIFQRIADSALEHGDPPRVVAALRRIVEAGGVGACDWLITVARKAKDQGAVVVGLDRLAAQAFEQGDYERARSLYEELMQLQPDIAEFSERLAQVWEKLGLGVKAAPVEALEPAAGAPAAAAEPVAAPAGLVPLTDDDLDPETRAYVTASLTDIDLFSSYGMTQKAIELAEQVIQRVPGHLVANERLLDFYLGSGNEQGVVTVAQRLADLHRLKGDSARAEELAQLSARYEEKAGAPAPAAAAEEVREVDLTTEWATLTEEAPAEEAAVEVVAPAAFNPDEVRVEIKFYLDQGMLKEARVALERYEEQFPGEAVLAELRQQVEAAAAPAPAPAEEGAVVQEAEEEEAPAAPLGGAEPAEVAAAPEETYEVSLEEQPQQGGAMAAADFFSDLAGELDSVVASQPPPPAGAPPQPARAAATAESQEGVDALAEIFEEFKQELGAVEEVEDIETHYNLGIAFKEMGLYDEAISEFQKVFKGAQKQKAYGNLIQCCTLLGMCFMDKAMPQIAVGWYERALKAPGLDPEGAMAIRYDMGIAHEQAGNRKAALDCYMEVYGLNVDFRDVGDRIRQLQG